MIPLTSCIFLFLFHLLIINSAGESCPSSFPCSNIGLLEFPLSNMQPSCGLFMVNCTSSPYPTIQFQDGGTWYEVHNKLSLNKFKIFDRNLQGHLNNNACYVLNNLSLPRSPSSSFMFSNNLTFYRCINESAQLQNHFALHDECPGLTVYYRNQTNSSANIDIPTPSSCIETIMPRNPMLDSGGLFDLLTAEFTLEWHISDDCNRCYRRGGQCSTNNMNIFLCKTERRQTTVIIASAVTGGGVLLICLTISFVFWLRKKRIKTAYFHSRNISTYPSSKSDVEVVSSYCGISIFCYLELEEATNNFDPSKELGDGGFGTVYHGVLKDGREVAVKRLYEHNYKRVEQFMNEIKLLTCLKHPNLVILYGCTSRRSRELLLVYEYVPNGTVADHLHGERAKESPLTWPMRMNIAIETASALAYLHKSDIVHRDVKTTNILLDSNFCIKVADFGLSRLFPEDVTHISTAPQGTPGYVDPDYHQCYQLTDRSDVYSFGVVLVELISSMPAVDITRHRHEINLANFAINRIQKCEFDGLIDSSLGYKTDSEVMRMTTSVAELAFQCLQLETNMRPSMDEVLGVLREIKNGAGKIPPSPETDDVVLLKQQNFLCSPTAVIDPWIYSGSTTMSSVDS